MQTIGYDRLENMLAKASYNTLYNKKGLKEFLLITQQYPMQSCILYNIGLIYPTAHNYHKHARLVCAYPTVEQLLRKFHFHKVQ